MGEKQFDSRATAWVALGALLLVLAGAPVAAQSAGESRPAVSSLPNPVRVEETATATAPARVVPALTLIQLALDDEVGSKISTTGAGFAFHLFAPIMIDGREVIAAGTPGQGEVIHAKHAGGSGAAGELVLAARFLTVGNRKLKLRSLRVAVAGQDAIKTIDVVNAASAASPVPISVIGYFITGRNIVMTKGTVVLAKTAEDFTVGEEAKSTPNTATHEGPSTAPSQ